MLISPYQPRSNSRSSASHIQQFVMTKHYDIMMEELKPWIFVASVIINDAWQMDQNSNRENKWI